MPKRSSKLSKIWQELKRRRVVYVISVYASASFVLIELVNNVVEPLNLPKSLPGIVIIALAVGFPVCIILSWIFDITPEGVEKTKSSKELEEGEKVETPNSWRIATYVSVVVIIGLIAFNIFSHQKSKQNPDLFGKSIAVLPFRNDSPDEENVYFINGTMEAILDNLSKIQGLRVVSRTTAEVYRDIPKSIPTVAEEMKVSYILEGSMQKYGNMIRLNMQLIDATDRHLWSKPYNREIKRIEELLALQSEIAQLVAAEIEVVITPEEKQLIEKIATRSLSAYDFYQRGLEEFKKYRRTDENKEVLANAENFYHLALENDPSFAKAYAGLASVYWTKMYWSEFFSENSLDSVLILANKALSFDNQLAEAYNLKGRYYQHIGKVEQAIEEFDRAIHFNPNDWQAYFEKGRVVEDYALKIESFHHAAIRCQDATLESIFMNLWGAYLEMGFIDQAKHYIREGFKLNGDSANYLGSLAWYEFMVGNYNSAVVYLEEVIKLDSGYLALLAYHEFYTQAGQDEKAYLNYKKLIVLNKNSEVIQLDNTHRIAYALWKAGDYKGADYYFNQQIEYCNESIRLNREYALSKFSHYNLAGIYAFLGDKEKAYTYLDEFATKEFIAYWLVVTAKNDLLFENMREEERYQRFIQQIESRYLAEHERVRILLEEKGLL